MKCILCGSEARKVMYFNKEIKKIVEKVICNNCNKTYKVKEVSRE